MDGQRRYPIAYDFTRLASRIFSRTPNGIDRVDMAYAQYFLGGGSGNDSGLLYLGPFGMRLVQRERANDALRGIESHYGESAGRIDVGLLAAVADWTAGRSGNVRAGEGFGGRQQRRRCSSVAKFTFRTLAAAGSQAALALPEKARYLCVSQFPLSERGAYDWLRKRTDVKAVFFIHDLLPLQYPEYFLPREPSRHSRRLEQLANMGSGALVSSRAVADVLREEMNRLGRHGFPIYIAPMPLAGSFVPGPASMHITRAAPYFILCSTIEPRKNHLTILHVWREMSAVLGPLTPKLILVGARGWENENVVDLLDRSPAIREHVLELSDVATPTLVELIRGARALLMPSFAEGYGLPVAEARALGVPVIASDIPVFHEVTGGEFTAVPPTDGPGWLSAVTSAQIASPALRPPSPPARQLDFSSLREFLQSL
jgi:glycosyltransferase involved in cell wall biosynthesis